MHLDLKPAYGRQYTTPIQVIRDFELKKDFIDCKSQLYCNIDDCINNNIEMVTFVLGHIKLNYYID